MEAVDSVVWRGYKRWAYGLPDIAIQVCALDLVDVESLPCS